jgi:glycerol dehydrogenase
MPKIIGFPSLYVQGPDALGKLGPWLDGISVTKRAAALVDPFVMPIFEAAVSEIEHRHAVRVKLLPFSSECTRREINRLVSLMEGDHYDAVLGVGGGKALDTAKAMAHALSAPIAIVPTIASSDAPTSRLIAIYDENHKIVEVPRLRRNPDAVFVDTSIIRSAPRRFFVAGIGDAFTKKFEVADSRSAGLPNFFDAAPTELSSLLADRCYEIIRSDAIAALDIFEQVTPTAAANDAFERVVEATVLYSGLAFEGGGLSVAHGLLRGLTPYPQTQQVLHGELVTYGLMVQLAANDAGDDLLSDIRQFLLRVGLPVSLAGIGLKSASSDDIQTIASLAFETPYLKSRSNSLSAETIASAMRRIEDMTQDRIGAASCFEGGSRTAP